MSSDAECSLIIGADPAADRCGECPGIGQVLGGDHAACVVFDCLGPWDKEFAREVVPGDGGEFAGKQVLAIVQAQPLPNRWFSTSSVAECGGDEVAQLA